LVDVRNPFSQLRMAVFKSCPCYPGPLLAPLSRTGKKIIRSRAAPLEIE
jgi:hypothetical protein